MMKQTIFTNLRRLASLNTRCMHTLQQQPFYCQRMISLSAFPSTITISKASFAKKVTIDEAKLMARKYEELSNDVLVTIAVLGDQEAREERLIREIMAVDNVSWEAAQPTFFKIVESNRRGLFISTLPYKIGIGASVGAAFISIPMIFDLDTVMLFNEYYVTSDVPEPKDLETPLEVGSWAWNWMEPPLGQISFFLLCMQYARSQLENLGAKPYTGWFKGRRAARLVKEFPTYNPLIVIAFSEGDPLTGPPIQT